MTATFGRRATRPSPAPDVPSAPIRQAVSQPAGGTSDHWLSIGPDKQGRDQGITVFALWWTGALSLLWLIATFMPLFGNDTELMPRHFGLMALAMLAALALGVNSAVVLWTQTRIELFYRLIFVVLFSLFATTDTFKVSTHLINAYGLSHDFPAAQIETSTFYWPIDRAYTKDVKTGRNSSIEYFVRLTPAWDTDWEIAKSDFDYMKANNKPENASRYGDRIESHGWFCAKVTLQKAGNAVKVVGVTDGRGLAEGSLMLCPDGAGTPALELK